METELKSCAVRNNLVLLKEDVPKGVLPAFEVGVVYRVASIRIIPRETILPKAYIDMRCIPDSYLPHLINGLYTTNHDLMGSDRFITVNGVELSARWFRLATAAEVNQLAKNAL